MASCRHWSPDLPYRAITAVRENQANGVVLYQVAGAADEACGAKKALKLALKTHGGQCFYCKNTLATETSEQATLDHIEPAVNGGKNELSNLVVACKPCNVGKGQSTIDAYNPRASKEWLTALLAQVQDRLNRIDSTR